MASKSQETYAETFQPHHQKPMFSLILLQTAATFSSRSRAAGAPRAPRLPHGLGILAGWPEAAKTTLAGSQTSRCHDSTVVRSTSKSIAICNARIRIQTSWHRYRYLGWKSHYLRANTKLHLVVWHFSTVMPLTYMSCSAPMAFFRGSPWLHPHGWRKSHSPFLFSSRLESCSSRLIVDVIIYITFCPAVVHQASWT